MISPRHFLSEISPMSRATWPGAIAIVVVLATFISVTVGRTMCAELYENVYFALRPSAAIAYAFGTNHLDVHGDAGMYDMRRAEHFLLEATAREPYYPYANHQLARIAFLKGKYALALSRIEVEIDHHGSTHHNSYYIKGLIEGYAGDYKASVADYEHYLAYDPHNWAAINDLAWVLLKDKQFKKAEHVTQDGLLFFPDSPWLLNSHAIALYELGDYARSNADLIKASALVASTTPEIWSKAYPGNDPSVASQGVNTLQNSIHGNLSKVRAQQQTQLDLPH